jgi:hypothetical protein
LLGRCSTAQPCLQPFLLSLFWRWGSCFLCKLAWARSSYFILPAITEMSCICHHTQFFFLFFFFSIEMRSLKLFCPGWLRTEIFISASQRREPPAPLRSNNFASHFRDSCLLTIKSASVKVVSWHTPAFLALRRLRQDD